MALSHWHCHTVIRWQSGRNRHRHLIHLRRANLPPHRLLPSCSFSALKQLPAPGSQRSWQDSLYNLGRSSKTPETPYTTPNTPQLEAKSSPASNKSHTTHTSQQSTLATVTLPPTVPTASNRYRSVNDPSLKEAIRNPIRYRVRDTPGHGKLRVSQGLAELSTMSQSKDIKNKLRGVLFMVDTAALVDETTLRDTATYLHDVLLVLQKRAKNGSSSKRTTEIPVLVAANKQDLFTALPPGSVREKLEAEIERIRKSKNKGLLDAADTGLEDDEEILANDEEETFSFKLLEFETGIKVEVVGGAVKGDSEENFGSGVRRWEEWVGMCL